jgi:hypothetical protein
MNTQASRLGWLFLALSACGEPPGPEPLVCAEGNASSALTAVDRKIIGDAAPYTGALDEGEAEHLGASQRDRRLAAWRTVAQVLQQVPLEEPLPNGASLPSSVARWQTWYDVDDVRRVFHHLYEGLTPAQRAARAHFSYEAIDDAVSWNVGVVDELWTEQQYLAYLEAIDTEGEVAGLAGISRVMYSPSAVRHMVQSYPQVLGCREDGVAPKVAGTPGTPTNVARPHVKLAACGSESLGPYHVGIGEALLVELEEPFKEGRATLTASAGNEVCEVEPGETCRFEGPTEVSVRVDANGAPLDSDVSVMLAAREVEWAGCLDGPFPSDAVIVKADYRRADFGMKLPVYDTSAQGMLGQLAGNAEWHSEAEADPGPAAIHTLTMPAGSNYRLAALHIMTKELDHWQWVTLWWSNTPDEDFGADRTVAVAALGGPWKNYKMCTVTAFEEGDDAAGGGFDASFPSLASALTAVYGGEGAPSWCSNPYLEEGHGNASTNCIGCHQHGGTDLQSEGILTYDDFGRTQLRNNFPSDYSWALVDGDELGLLFQQEEQYWQGK